MSNKIKFPEVFVELVGQDGNVFNLIGLTSKALKRAGYVDEAKEFAHVAISCSSYDEVLQLIMNYVTVK